MVNEHVGFTLDVLPGTMAGITAALGGFNELVAATSMFATAVGRSTSVVDSMILTLGVGLAGAAWESAKAFGEVERSMKIVQAVSGQTSSEISVLTQKANEFSVKYKMGIDDMTAGLQTLGRAGLSSVNTQIDTLQAGLQAAKTQGIALDDALNKIVQTTSLLGGDINASNFGQQAQDLTSKILATAMSAPIDMNDVVQTLSYSGGTAAAAGINIQNPDALYDYLGTISSFAQKGVTGSMAGTAMRAFFTKPASQDTSVVEALNKLDMKASDLWEQGGNKMRPVSEQIGLIHQQMDKLHMSTLDQIELWGKIVGPKMGQQMMKLDENAIKNNARSIRETASAEDLAATTMKNFMSELEELTQRGQKTWREYGNVAIAWIEPVIRGLNTLYDILGSWNVGGIPVIQQLVKVGIIVIISQVIQKLGNVWNLFKNIAVELRNILATGSQSTRTTEQLAAEEQKRLQSLGLTEEQAKTLTAEEGKLTKNLSTSNKVLAEFLIKLNEAVSLMAELANLSRIQSMGTISNISAAQHDRYYSNIGTGLAKTAWSNKYNGNVGHLTRNEFAQLSLRHGIPSNQLESLYYSRQFQQFAQKAQNQSNNQYKFANAISLEKYLQENQKGMYDPELNPLMGVVQGVKADTDKLVQIASKPDDTNNQNKNNKVEEIKNDIKTKTEDAKNSVKQARETARKTHESMEKNVANSAKEIPNIANRKGEETKSILSSKIDALLAVRRQGLEGQAIASNYRTAEMHNRAIVGGLAYSIADLHAKNSSYYTNEMSSGRFIRGQENNSDFTNVRGKNVSYRSYNLERAINNANKNLPKLRKNFEATGSISDKKAYMKTQIGYDNAKNMQQYQADAIKRQEALSAKLNSILSGAYTYEEQQRLMIKEIQKALQTETQIRNQKITEYKDAIGKTELIQQEINAHQRQLGLLQSQISRDEASLAAENEKLESQQATLATLQKRASKGKQTEQEATLTQQYEEQVAATTNTIKNINQRINDNKKKEEALAVELADYMLLQMETQYEMNRLTAQIRDAQYKVLGYTDAIGKNKGEIFEYTAMSVDLEKVGLSEEESVIASMIRHKEGLEQYIAKQQMIINDEQKIKDATSGNVTAAEELLTAYNNRLAAERKLAEIEATLYNKLLAQSNALSFNRFPGANSLPTGTNQYGRPIGPMPALNPNNLGGVKGQNFVMTDPVLAKAANMVNAQVPKILALPAAIATETSSTPVSKNVGDISQISSSILATTNKVRENTAGLIRTTGAWWNPNIKNTATVAPDIDPRAVYNPNFALQGGAYNPNIPGMQQHSSGVLQLEQTAKTFQTGLRYNISAMANDLRGKFSTSVNNASNALRGLASRAGAAYSSTWLGQKTSRYTSGIVGFGGTIKSSYLSSLAERQNYNPNAGFWRNWATNSGMSAMVNWGAIRNTTKEMGLLGKVAGVTGGALGSFGMMFGPAEVAMMGFSLVMQGIQQAQQKYQEELEKINSRLSEAREDLEKAEESFASAYEEQNPNATQEQKDQAYLNLYLNGEGDRDDGLDSYRANVQGALNKIEINTREKAKKENDFWFGAQGGAQKGFWSHWDEFWGTIFDNSNITAKNELGEQFDIAAEGAKATDEYNPSKTNSAQQLETTYQSILGTTDDISYRLDYTLSHYENWIDDLEDYSSQAKYATALINTGMDSTGASGGSDFYRTYGDYGAKTALSQNGINDYRAFEKSLSKIPASVQTQITNSINEDPDFYKRMQRQMFSFKDNKLQRTEGNEVKILQAIRKRVGNITTEQAKQTLILSTISSIHDFVQNQIQPTLMANVESSMQGVNTLGLTNMSVGYTGNTTSAVHQGVMNIIAQLGTLIEQKTLENMSLLSESAGINFKDLNDLARAYDKGDSTALPSGYSMSDAGQARKIMDTMMGMYAGTMVTKGMSQEDAYKYAQTKFGELYNAKTINGKEFTPEITDMMRTWEKWFTPTMTPYVEEQWAKSLTDRTGTATGPESTDKDKSKDKDKDSSSNRKNWVNLAICNKKEIPKLNVNLFKKPPNFTILNRNFKLRDVNVNTADDAKSIQNAVKNSIIEIQNRSNPKIIQDDAAEYDPVNATDGNTLPVGTKKTE